MSTLTFSSGDPTWLRLRERAKKDLYYLTSTVLGYAPLVPMEEHAHRLLCRLVDGTLSIPAIDDAQFLKLLLPRYWGKTCLITIGRTIQRLCVNPECSTLICNEKQETAADMLAEIKGHFTNNEFFRSLFPELIPPSFQDTTWSTTRITIARKSFRKEPSIFVIGVGGTVTGLHPDYIIVDDMISREAAEAARRGNWQIMEQVNRWTHQLEGLLADKTSPGNKLTFIGTRWFHNDCYDHIDSYFGTPDEAQEWRASVPVGGGRKQSLPLTKLGRLVTFERSVREEGQWSWPQKYDEERMLKIQQEDPILYAANFENKPSNDTTATFRAEWLRDKVYSWLDPHTVTYVPPVGARTALHLAQLDIVFLVDPGGFGKGTEDRARAAVLVVGHTPTGEFLLLDCWNEKDTYIACQQKIVEFAKRYRPRKIGIENAGQQIAFIDQVKQQCQAAGILTAFQELKHQGKEKDDRILQLEPYFQRGLVYLGSGALWTEFRTQYQQFPRTARRDLLDALAYLSQVVRARTGLVTSGPLTGPSRVQTELDTYYRKRGITYRGLR